MKFFAVIVFALASFGTPILGLEVRALASKNAKPDESQSYGAFYREIPATQLKNWNQNLLNRPISAKIEPLPDLAREFVIAFNKHDGFSQIPKPRSIDPQTKADLVAQLQKLPQDVRSFLDNHIIGIYTAENVGGTAMAGSVYQGGQGPAKFGFIILDLNMVGRPINAWATFKENTVFAPVKGYHLTLTLAEGQTDNQAATIRFILCHEIGHVFHAVTGMQPAYHEITWKDEQFSAYPFNRPELDRRKRLGGDYYPLYAKISFYRPTPPFDLDDGKKVYEWLVDSSHPTLYSAVNELEDFAETFALLLHVKYFSQPYDLKLSHDNKTLVSFSHRLQHHQVAAKVKMIEQRLLTLNREQRQPDSPPQPPQ